MRKTRIGAAALAAAFAITASSLFPTVSAAHADKGFTRFQITYNPECYADITINGSRFTIDGRVAEDPVILVKFSSDDVTVSDYQFTEDDEDHSFHTEFDAEFSGDWCELRIVKESRLYMGYRIHHDENGWYFPDNGLVALNAEKLENINTAPAEAAAYYISETADPTEIEETLAELEGVVREVCGDEQDDYQKAYLLYRWISENFYYDKDAADTSVTLDTVAIHNVLERRRTTCAGFSNTYCALLEIAGIRSVNLKGTAVATGVTYEELLTAGENHEFAAFRYEAENRWVFADPTWGRSGTYENGEYICDYPASYKYFDESPEAFALKHRIDKVEERSYTGALAAISEEETAAGTTEAEEPSTEAATTTKAPTTTLNDSGTQNGDYAILYLIIGAAGVVIVMIGIILAIKKRK